MKNDLEERFHKLYKEKEKLISASQKAEEALSMAESEEPTSPKPFWKRELPYSLLSLLAGVLFGWGVWAFFADQIVGPAFDPQNWWPPDEAEINGNLIIQQGLWRSFWGPLLTIIVSVLGVYLYRLTFYFLTKVLPQALPID